MQAEFEGRGVFKNALISDLPLLFSPEILLAVLDTVLAYQATLAIRSGGGTGWRRRDLAFSPSSSAPSGAPGTIGNLTVDNETPSPLMTLGAAGMPQASSALIN